MPARDPTTGRFTGGGGAGGGIVVPIGADDSGLVATLSRAAGRLDAFGKRLDALGDKFESAGEDLTMRLSAPVALFAGFAVRAFDSAAQAAAGVADRIRSTGGAAGKAAEELEDAAGALQSLTRFDGDDILQGVTQQLLTFTNVQGDVFDRAQKAALDLSTVLGQDLQSSAIQLGKALNNPAEGLTALRRVGVTFTEQQKAQIVAMQAAGDIAGAQAIILGELEREFGGAAEAAAKAGAGPIVQLGNALGDLTEAIGEAIAVAVNPLATSLKALAERATAAFEALPDGAKKTIVVLMGIAAAAGPVLLGLGSVAKLGGLLSQGLALVASPAGLVVAALAALAAGAYYLYTRWDDLTKAFPELTVLASAARQVFDAAASTLRQVFGQAVETVRGVLARLKNDGSLAAFKAQVQRVLAAIVAFWREHGDTVLTVVRRALSVVGSVIGGLLRVIGGVVQFWMNAISGNWRGAFGGLAEVAKGALRAAGNIVLGNLASILNALGVFASAIPGVGDVLARTFEGAAARVDGLRERINALTAVTAGGSTPVVTGSTGRDTDRRTPRPTPTAPTGDGSAGDKKNAPDVSPAEEARRTRVDRGFEAEALRIEAMSEGLQKALDKAALDYDRAMEEWSRRYYEKGTAQMGAVPQQIKDSLDAIRARAVEAAQIEFPNFDLVKPLQAMSSSLDKGSNAWLDFTRSVTPPALLDGTDARIARVQARLAQPIDADERRSLNARLLELTGQRAALSEMPGSLAALAAEAQRLNEAFSQAGTDEERAALAQRIEGVRLLQEQIQRAADTAIPLRARLLDALGEGTRSFVDGLAGGIGEVVGQLSSVGDVMESLSGIAKRLVADLVAAIAKALILKAIEAAIGGATGGAGGFIAGALGMGGKAKLDLLTGRVAAQRLDLRIAGAVLPSGDLALSVAAGQQQFGGQGVRITTLDRIS